MNNLIRIKQIIDHITKEPLYPTTHAIGVGYTDKNGECITVQEALDSLKNAFEVLSEYYLTLGYGDNQAFPGNEGKELQDLLESLTVDDSLNSTSTKPVQNKIITQALEQLRDTIDNVIDNMYTQTEVDSLLNNKQDTLQDGINVKTINSSSILGSGNFLLADLDEDTKASVTYKALKQGQEQMLVLKSMGDLDIIPLDASLEEFDLNDDGTINYAEVSILQSIILGGKYDGFYYRAVHQDENDPTSRLLLQKSEDQEHWETVPNKNPDIEQDHNITAADVTAIYRIIINANTEQGVGYDQNEFVGRDTIFSVYDSEEKKIIIGYNFEKYIDPSKDKDQYTILTLDPSPNVIYCNSFNNKLYRWNANSEDMVELNISSSATISRMESLLRRVRQVEDQIEGLEELVNPEDSFNHEEQTTP